MKINIYGEKMNNFISCKCCENLLLTVIVIVKGHLPVIESIGFDSYIKEQTSGQAFPSLSFSHWKLMDSKIKDDIVDKIRKRKKLKSEIPKYENYNNKL